MSYRTLIENIKKDREYRKHERARVGTDQDWKDMMLGVHNHHSISFTLHAKHYYPGKDLIQIGMCPDYGISLINLDEEDLDYLYNKYYPKVDEEIKKEKQEEIERLIKQADKLRKEVEIINSKIIKLEE